MQSSATENPSESSTLDRFRAEVAEDLSILAMLQERELNREQILSLWENGYSDFLGLRLSKPAGQDALGLFFHGLTDIPASLDQSALDLLAAEYADIYLNHGLGASPCESPWVDEENLAMQESMFQVRAAYQRHGLAVPDWRIRADDHLVYQLQFLSSLIGGDGGEEALKEAAYFMDEHCLRWIDQFAERVATRCGSRFYAGLARVTAAYLDEVRDLLERILELPRLTAEEIAARQPKAVTSQVLPMPSFVPGSAPTW